MPFPKPKALHILTITYFCLVMIAPAYAEPKAESGIAPQIIENSTLEKDDASLSCDQIAHEVVGLDRTIRAARSTQVRTENTGTGVTVARTVGSLLIGSLGGVVGIAAVGALAGEAVENAGENAATIEEKAEERQNRLAGIFEGKGCEGELALTEDSPENVAKTEPAAGSSAAPAPRRYND